MWTASSAVESKLVGKEDPNEKTSILGGIFRFIISAIWFIVTFVASVLALYGMWAGDILMMLGADAGPQICICAIGLCFLIFLITFIIPYLRKKGSMTRWCGIVALGDAICWAYFFFTEFVQYID